MTPNELFEKVKQVLNSNQRPADRLKLVISRDKSGEKITRASIQFNDNASYSLLSISYSRKSKQVNVRRKYEEDFKNRLLPFEYSVIKSDDVWIHTDITHPDELDAIADIICRSYDDSPFRETFGCCDLYEQCSDAKRCLHRDLQYAKACLYRRNLEAGRIFYGKNKTL